MVYGRAGIYRGFKKENSMLRVTTPGAGALCGAFAVSLGLRELGYSIWTRGINVNVVCLSLSQFDFIFDCLCGMSR